VSTSAVTLASHAGTEPGFVDVRLSSHTAMSRYEIVVSRGRTIRVPGGSDSEELGRLIAVVEVVCRVFLRGFGASTGHDVGWTWVMHSRNPNWLMTCSCDLFCGAMRAEAGSLTSIGFKTGFYVFAAKRRLEWKWFWWPSFGHHVVAGKAVIHYFIVPLWMPFLLILIPSAYLWYQDWRYVPPGHCQKCGYDLTGNESGRCPECGTAIERVTSTGHG
jgi:hypothetical protein